MGEINQAVITIFGPPCSVKPDDPRPPFACPNCKDLCPIPRRRFNRLPGAGKRVIYSGAGGVNGAAQFCCEVLALAFGVVLRINGSNQVLEFGAIPHGAALVPCGDSLLRFFNVNLRGSIARFNL